MSLREQEVAEWGLSCSTGGLDADGVRAYMAPWIATVNDLRERLRRAEAALRQIREHVPQELGEIIDAALENR